MKNQHNDSWDKIEKNWRDKLQGHSLPPSEDLWSQLEEQLSKKEKPKPVFISQNSLRKYGYWAAIFVLSIGLNWYFVWNKKTEEPSIVQLKIPSKRPLLIPSVAKTPKPASLVKEPRIQANASKQFHSTHPVEKVIEHERVENNPIIPLPEQKTEVIANQPMEQESSEEVWVKVSIDPLPASPALEKLTEARPVEKKKKNLFKLITQIKNLMNGESNNQEVPENLRGGIHQVANTYYRTEEKLKQTFQ